MKERVRIQDIGKPAEVLSPLSVDDLEKIPGHEDKPFKPVKDDWKEKYDFSLDGFSALSLPKPKTKEEEDALVNKFLKGLEKMFSKENNWTFLMPASLSTEYCVRCNTCNEACPIYTSSGHKDIYRPNYRSEILRKIYKKYFTTSGKLLGGFVGADIDLNWQVINRLAELSYRCSICRRCASTRRPT